MLSELSEKHNLSVNPLKNYATMFKRTLTILKNLLKELSENLDELISWAELYDSASLEKKKMVVNALINRIEVFRDYKVKIDFNFDFEQFTNGLDYAA